MEHKQANNTKPSEQSTKKNCGRKRIYATDDERREAKLRQTAESNRRINQQRRELYDSFNPLQREILKILSNKALPFDKTLELYDIIKKEDPMVQEYYQRHPHRIPIGDIQYDIVKKMCTLPLSYDQCCDICDIIEGTKSEYVTIKDIMTDPSLIENPIIKDLLIDDVIDK
jgi:hypothetical protein